MMDMNEIIDREVRQFCADHFSDVPPEQYEIAVARLVVYVRSVYRFGVSVGAGLRWHLPELEANVEDITPPPSSPHSFP